MMFRRPKMLCPKCGKPLDGIVVGDPLVLVVPHDTDERLVSFKTGRCLVLYRCHGEEWSVSMLEEDAKALVSALWRNTQMDRIVA